MAIWVGKQKMSCRSCIKGHRSSTCNHLGGPLWAVRPAGRPNKACVHGPGDLCLCAHYFPLTWLKAAVPRNKKCSCEGEAGKVVSGRKCMCGGQSTGAALATPDSEDTQPIFFQDLVARGLRVTSEPSGIEIPAQAPTSCCSARPSAPLPVQQASCCSVPASPVPAVAASASTLPSTLPSSCCSQSDTAETANGLAFAYGHVKTESSSVPPFLAAAPPAVSPIHVSRFHSIPALEIVTNKAAQALHANTGNHSCECGPTCNCVLCVEHPYNTATMNHIASEFGQMMAGGADLSPESGPQAGMDMFGKAWSPSSSPISNRIVARPYNDPPLLPHQSSPPAHATDIFLNPADFQMFNYAFPLDNIDQYNPRPSFSYGPMPGLDMTGLCAGTPEGCPCGDDCTCIGCQVHGNPPW